MVWIKCEIPKEYCTARSSDGGCALKTTCRKLVEQCFGKDGSPDCTRIEGEYCKAYINPESKWRNQKECPLASHLVKETKSAAQKRRIGQQKQRRRK